MSPTNVEGSFAACNATLSSLQASYDACGCGVDPCDTVVPAAYDLGLHIGAVVVILCASLTGALVPLLSKYSRFGVDPYYVALGKQVGTGIVLACALIHMLQPAAASLTSACVPWEFNEDYQAYAFLFAMLAALLLHFFESVLTFRFAPSPTEPTTKEVPESVAGGALHGHPVIALTDVDRLVQMYSMEFALTVHSVFIGLTVGVVGYNELQVLLVALTFHQMFEGVALGSRLADAPGLSRAQLAVFVVIFALSSPLGIMSGILVETAVNPNGIAYLLTEGTLDGSCAGLLLYVGFQLLLQDFPQESERLCRGRPNEKARRAGMFLALWTGAGFMAFIGKYL